MLDFIKQGSLFRRVLPFGLAVNSTKTPSKFRCVVATLGQPELPLFRLWLVAAFSIFESFLLSFFYLEADDNEIFRQMLLLSVMGFLFRDKIAP